MLWVRGFASERHAVAQEGTRSPSENVFKMAPFPPQFFGEKSPLCEIKHEMCMCYLQITEITYKKWET